MQRSQRIAFIGAGNMASALIEGLISAGTWSAQHITAADVRADALASLEQRHAVRTTTDNTAAVRDADVVVLCTKPQVLPAILLELQPYIGVDKLVISIAAGVPAAVIESQLGENARLVRAMPNTPALVQAGATAIAAGKRATSADLDLAETVFRSVGVVERVPEALMDAVTAVSGSGPAYVFLLVEALSSAGVRVGLAEATAATLAAQTVFGAGKLLHESGEPPATLRARVSSPGGTTVAGIEQLEQRDFRGTIAAAVQRATDRARELGAEASAKLSTPGHGTQRRPQTK
jgi:pyrroline-5-carboxylate reductase